MEITGYILFVPIIFFIVVFHELGHFLLAKLFKIKVEEFAIGFPPRIYAKKIFSTIISLNIIPLGGYVKLPDIEKPDMDDVFSAKLSIKKIIIFTSGSLFNFFLTFIIIVLMYMSPHQSIAGDIFIQKIAPGSPAKLSGLMDGDVIKQINGENINNIDQLISSINNSSNKLSSIRIARVKNLSSFNSIQDIQTLDFNLTPRTSVTKRKVVSIVADSLKEISLKQAQEYNSNLLIGDFMTEGKIGILINMKNTYQTTTKLNFLDSISKSYKTNSMLFKNIKYIFVSDDNSAMESKFTGPIGIAQITNQSSKQGFQSIAELIALISFSLGIFNLIPFPPLDGGKVLFEIFTLIRKGKPVPNFITNRIQLIGIIILFSLIVYVTMSDIRNIINN